MKIIWACKKGEDSRIHLSTCHLSCEHIDWHIGKFPMSPKQPLLDVEKISKLDLGFDVVSCCLLKPSIRSISQFFRMIPCLKSAGLKDYEIYESSWHPLVIYELDKKNHRAHAHITISRLQKILQRRQEICGASPRLKTIVDSNSSSLQLHRSMRQVAGGTEVVGIVGIVEVDSSKRDSQL